MSATSNDLAVLDLPHGVTPDPDELVVAAMKWHFGEETGTPFWIERAKTLGFDPLHDVKGFGDLTLFPNVTDELRGVPAHDLIARGFGPKPDVVAVIESGGTTGAPKRLPMMKHFADLLIAQDMAGLKRGQVSSEKDWLILMPSGPHGAFEQARRSAAAFGVLAFGIDMDPRWVKKQLAAGNKDVVEDYIDHIIDQAGYLLDDQNIGQIRLTPPILSRLAAREDLVELIREKVDGIGWGGAHMNVDTRHYLQTEVFPSVRLSGGYGTTMALGAGGTERAGLAAGEPCVYDPHLAPYVTFSVVDPGSGRVVDYGDRGQLVVNLVSKSFLLPNNAERDMATRITSPDGQAGDSIADITPLQEFGGKEVIEGVY